VRIEQLAWAEPGWKAVFTEPDGNETMSRIVAWAVVGRDDSEVAGVIVDPSEPSRMVLATDASSPDGGSFLRYRFVQPDPIVVTAPAPPPPAADTTEQVAKNLLKRRR
jgi:hypothetical protein